MFVFVVDESKTDEAMKDGEKDVKESEAEKNGKDSKNEVKTWI